jgi:hypothetical protein
MVNVLLKSIDHQLIASSLAITFAGIMSCRLGVSFILFFLFRDVWLNYKVTSGTWTNATLIAALQNHIANEVTHYKGQCYAWDVVNEAFNDDGSYRVDVFYSTVSAGYLQVLWSLWSPDPFCTDWSRVHPYCLRNCCFVWFISQALLRKSSICIRFQSSRGRSTGDISEKRKSPDCFRGLWLLVAV